MLEKYDNFFTDAECNQVVEDILKRKEQFIPRSESLSYYGGNFFDHLAKTDFDLLAAINTYNQVKDNPEYTGYWHDMLLEKLSKIVSNPQYMPHMAKPGFHLIETAYPGPGIWHYNSEKILFPYQDDFPDYTGDINYFDGVYTFTLMLTEGDFTFDYFPETLSEWLRNPLAELENTPCFEHLHLDGDICPNTNCTLKEYQTVHYKKGTLLLQDQRFMHRIGSSSFTGNNRVTMQGHAVTKNNNFYLYW